MKPEFRTLIALSIMTLSTAVLPAVAAENEALRVTVPFAFTAGTATLPAGDYVISRQVDNHILTIGGSGGGAILLAISQDASGELRASNLIFERTDKGNRLMQVQMYGKPSVILNHGK
jgi:hypothetical protein